MPPGKRIVAKAPVYNPVPYNAATGRKVTRTLIVDTTPRAAEAMAKRMDPPLELTQVEPTFQVERIAGPRNTNPRWRFNIPGQMLVVAEADLPLIEALILAINTERQQP